MNNYEMIRAEFPNADPETLGSVARELYKKRMIAPTNLLVKPYDDTFERWIFEEADVALKFNIGQLVKIDDDKNPYGIVVGYWQYNMGGCPITQVVVSTSNGNLEMAVDKLRPSDVPMEILELAKAQLRRNQDE